jgi:hypothetical protein
MIDPEIEEIRKQIKKENNRLFNKFFDNNLNKMVTFLFVLCLIILFIICMHHLLSEKFNSNIQIKYIENYDDYELTKET